MSITGSLQPKKVFEYFEKICAIPHGSGNMEKIADFCVDFAKNHGLDYRRDRSDNVVIYKGGSAGYENSAPVILQGHLDMVCQKTEDCLIDFEEDGLDLYVDGDFLKARGTTLGADNGIAVAIILAILEREDLSHPPIEALLTTDEETGMYGAMGFDGSWLSGKRLINMDSENEDILTVSCAGGSNCTLSLNLDLKKSKGTLVTVKLFGLQGGHSGVDINRGRVNANVLMGRFLNTIDTEVPFWIVSVYGGDKGNVIPFASTLEVLTDAPDDFCKVSGECLETIRKEICAREPGFGFTIRIEEECEKEIISNRRELIFLLACAPNGILKMSAEIEGLVETSLNMGVVRTVEDLLEIVFALRSNKMSALYYLQKKLDRLCDFVNCMAITDGVYPAWEFKENSILQEKYKEVYRSIYGKEPVVEAIHAGLECGVLAGKINDLDCISIGPEMYDVHTVKERLSISSTERFYGLVCKLLESLK